LDNEGAKREIVNDAQLFGMGVKRLQESHKVVLKEEERVIEFYIDRLCFMRYKNFQLILALFENNNAKVLDAKTLKVM